MDFLANNTLIVNTSFLVILTYLISQFIYNSRIVSKWIPILWISILSIAAVLLSVELTDGVRVDSRVVIIVFSGIAFGLEVALSSSFIFIVARFVQGGVGVASGWFRVVATLLLLIIYIKTLKKANHSIKWYEVAVFIVFESLLLFPTTYFFIPSAMQDQVLSFIPMTSIYLGISAIGIGLVLHFSRNAFLSNKRYQNIFLKSRSMTILLDKETLRISKANRAAQEFYGFSELIGMAFKDIQIDPDFHELVPNGRQENEGLDWSAEHRKADGSISSMRIYATEVEFQDREYFFLILHDISGQRAAEQAKQKFLSNLSHELKTPLNGILGMLQLLSGDLRKSEQRSFIELAEYSVLDLKQKLSDLLIFSPGFEFKPDIKVFDLVQLCRDKIAEFEGLKNTITFTLSVKSDPLIVKSHMEWFDRILENLLSNAVKFSSSGCIEISLTEKPFLQLSIRDEGIGISEEDVQAIFQPFEQLEDAFTKNYRGIGAGLYIVKTFCDLLDAKIDVESELGVGSTFILSFPKVELQDLSQREIGESSEQVTIQHVLIVEDDAINSLYLKRLLLMDNLQVEQAGNGAECMEMTKQQNFDAIFMDIGLPDISGIELIQELRNTDSYKNTIILAVTAYSAAEDIQQIMSAGADDVLNKPYNRKMLKTKLQSVLQRK
jgi:PAS domain S-box-containing protein